MAAQAESNVSAEYPFEVQQVDIFGSLMSYIDTQADDFREPSTPTALFLHGNVSSSYIWRNIIPHVSPVMRCVAPDLIGMGNSSKPANMSWRFTDHYTFLSAFIKAVVPSGPIILIMNDWGSGLGMHWAYQQSEIRSDRVIGLVLTEFVRPFSSLQDLGLPKPIEETFKMARDPVQGRKMIIESNALLEKVLPSAMARPLSERALEYYRRPFLEPASREPLYVWTNQIPIGGTPSDTFDIATRFHDWLLSEDCCISKLLLWATPGDLVSPDRAKWYMDRLQNAQGVHVGAGRHYLQEDQPSAVGKAIHDWAEQLLETLNH